MYNFGLYHWRRYARRLAGVGVAFGVAAVVWLRARGPVSRAVALGIALSAALFGARPARKTATPLPWRIDREKYDAFAGLLDLTGGGRLLDVGSGTGRSLVGVAPHLPADWSVTALDVFDDHIVLGNEPERARANAAEAGLDPTVLRGDATRLPFGDDTQDVVMVSRLLHDLPESEARAALAEARRTLAPNGQLGVLELPIVPDGADPAAHWRALVADAGFDVDAVARRPWKDDREYVLVTATPTDR